MNKLLTRLVYASLSTIMLACVSQPPIVTTVPGPITHDTGKTTTNVQSPPLPIPQLKTRWKFIYTPGAYTYNIVTAANIALQSDTTAVRNLPTVSEQATITVTKDGETEVTNPPPITSVTCDTLAALITRAQQLLPKIPGQLAIDTTWTDSSVTTGCRGSIPTTVKARYSYSVLPDTQFTNTQAIHIKRVDTLTAQGAGNEGQHQVALTATGTAIVHFYLDATSGTLLGASNVQVTKLDITTSGQIGHFLQHVTEKVALTKGP